jgi:hypothetical protein
MLDYIDVISAFRQGEIREGGNSVAIAVIKAAIEVFGLQGLFGYHMSGAQHYVVFRNGIRVSFSNAELSRATAVGGFHLHMGNSEIRNKLFKEIYDYANICFLCYAKAQHAHWCGQQWQQGL